MIKGIKCLLCFCIVLNLVACADKVSKSVIKFSADSTAVVLKNFSEGDLLKLKQEFSTQLDSGSLVAISTLPNDGDSLQDQLPVAGKCELLGDSIVFKPAQPFKKGKSYLVESFIGVQFANAGKLFSGSIKQHLTPQQQILKR